MSDEIDNSESELSRGIEDGGENIVPIDDSPTPSEGTIKKVTGALEKLIEEGEVDKSEVRLFMARFQGPVPPPNLLKEYEAIMPGAAKMIFTAAKEERHHRHEIENVRAELAIKETSANIISNRIGQTLSFLSLLAVLIASVWMASVGKTLDGVYLVIVAMALLVLAYTGSKLIETFPRIVEAFRKQK